MGKLVLTNAAVTVAGVDLSDHVSDVELDLTAADVDVTAMGAGGKQRLAGLQDNKVTITFWQDFAASSVDATLYAAFAAGSLVAFSVAAAGTAYAIPGNPKFSGTAIITDYPPIGGGVGDGLKVKATLSVSGTVTRGTV